MKNKDKRNLHIAVLDPDPPVLKYIQKALADRYELSMFTEASMLFDRLRESPAPSLLLMDWDIGGDRTEEGGAENGAIRVLTRIRAEHPSLPVIVLACLAETAEVVAAARMGAMDVLLKPFKKSDIDQAVQRCLEERRAQETEEGEDDSEIPLDENTSFVRACKRMREIESQCRLVARADIPVLVLGESGTGKEVATIFIHKMSARSKGSFVKVNCAAMPADLLESELFGYEPGAFTGAIKAKPGKFELCNKGTIFLDEIGEMPAALQAKLLQVLQDGSFSRLGSRSSVKVDVRVIAATNVDIKAAIAQKTFREDLYYRLNGFTLKMPPLRERTEEIPTLANHFMRKVAAKYERPPLPISPLLMQAFCNNPWPGNLRELENTIKRYLILGDEQAIIEELNPSQEVELLTAAADDSSGNGSLKHLVRNLKGGAESAAIAKALESTGWNRKAAANELQISYKALLYKIKQYSLAPPKRRQPLEAKDRV